MIWIIVILFIILVAAIYYIISLRDQLKKVEKNELKKLEEKRSSFISIISHQLRTPLSVVKGYLEALSTGDQGELNEGQQDYLNDALKINKESIKLVNDYLEAIRLDTKELMVKPEEIDLVQLTKTINERLLILAKAYNCRIELLEPEKELSHVKADRIKIQQVIENIIANAIKYSDGKGEIKINIKQDDKFVIFECRDRGIGIPADQMSEIFTKFFRAKNIIQKDTQGSGLGLYLAKEIIETLGGKIWVESVENKGTTVSFKLPVYNK